MKKTPHAFEILLVLDASSSMSGVRDAAVSAVNEFIAQQKQEEGEANFSLMLFASHGMEVYVFRNVPVKDVPELTVDDFKTSGLTALHDATGKGISDLIEVFKKKTSDLSETGATIGIYTDGGENNSRNYTQEQVKSMIKEVEEGYGWDVHYMASNPDERSMTVQAASMGVSASNIVTNSDVRTGAAPAMAMYLNSATVGSRNSYRERTNPDAQANVGSAGDSAEGDPDKT